LASGHSRVSVAAHRKTFSTYDRINSQRSTDTEPLTQLESDVVIDDHQRQTLGGRGNRDLLYENGSVGGEKKFI